MDRVNYLIFILTNKSLLSNEILGEVASFFSDEIDYIGESHLFEDHDYYKEEFGSPLYRFIISFETLSCPNLLVENRLKAGKLEKKLSRNGKRCYNLDVGYMDTDKLVLASLKYSGKKLYIDKGVYADMLLHYKKGCWYPFFWSFKDFCDNRYYKDLLLIRERYKKKL